VLHRPFGAGIGFGIGIGYGVVGVGVGAGRCSTDELPPRYSIKG
jgi:hypothetical protein